MEMVSKLARFGFLGLALNAAGFIIFSLLVGVLKFDAVWVVVLTTPPFVCLSYVLQKRWIFRPVTSEFSTMLGFSRNYLLVYLLNIFGLFVLVNKLSLNPLLCQFALIVTLGLLSYFLSKFLFEA
jgi:putative flippase GtrA